MKETTQVFPKEVLQPMQVVEEAESQEKTKMLKTCNKPLKQNPFTTYRDPKTGQWVVIKPKQ